MISSAVGTFSIISFCTLSSSVCVCISVSNIFNPPTVFIPYILVIIVIPSATSTTALACSILHPFILRRMPVFLYLSSFRWERISTLNFFLVDRVWLGWLSAGGATTGGLLIRFCRPLSQASLNRHWSSWSVDMGSTVKLRKCAMHTSQAWVSSYRIQWPILPSLCIDDTRSDRIGSRFCPTGARFPKILSL